MENQPTYVDLEAGKQCKKALDGVKNSQHEFQVNKDEEITKLRSQVVSEQEQSVIILQKQLETADKELKTNAEQIQNLKTELHKTERQNC